MRIEEWVELVSRELPRMAVRHDIPMDATRAKAFGVPCNLLTAVRMPVHDCDPLRRMLLEARLYETDARDAAMRLETLR